MGGDAHGGAYGGAAVAPVPARRRLALVLLSAAVLGGAAVWALRAQPDFVDRIRYPLRYEALIRAHAENYGIEPSLLASVIYTESRFDAGARSAAGAVGLMQLLPDTAKGIALRTGGRRFVVDDLLDPEINIRYGSWYLRNLLGKYGRLELALAAYHAGQGNVDAWRRKGQGIVFPETRDYVARVTRTERVYRRIYAHELGLSRN